MWKNRTKTEKKAKRSKKEAKLGKGEKDKTEGEDTAGGGEKQSKWESVLRKPSEARGEFAENGSGVMRIDESDSAKEMNEEKGSESEEGVAEEEQEERMSAEDLDGNEEERQREQIMERESGKESSDSSEKIYEDSEETTQSEGDNLDENNAKKPEEKGNGDVEREQIDKQENFQYREVSEDEFYESVIEFTKRATEGEETDQEGKRNRR